MSAADDISFGDFRIDARGGQLYRGDTPVRLAPKAFALLRHLVNHPGRLLSKEDLLKAVWPGVYVTDAVLKTTVRDVRRALGDDTHTPRFIETAHRRGYRFVAHTVAAEEAVAPAVVDVPTTVTPPTVHYTRSGTVNLAYQVVGSGPRDIVFVMGWVSHLEFFWNEPSFARFLRRLSTNARLILFDKRGTGLSDPVPVRELPTLEQRLDDVRAVMQAAGSERAVLMGVSEGGPLCTLFAATYPERTEALVMIGSYARRLRDDDYPWGPTTQERDEFCDALIRDWGGPVGVEDRAPSRARDRAFREWWASYLRMGASPGAAVALTRMNAAIDVRSVLPSVRVPTLVIHRTGDRCLRVEEGRYLARHIPGAELVELPGDDHLPFVGDQEAILDAVEQFLSRRHRRVGSERVLASVLTVCADGPLPRECEARTAQFRGRVVTRDQHTLVATFDGPGRAVGCASLLVAFAAEEGVKASAGVQVGECDVANTEDPVFAASMQLARSAPPGAVHASRTVVDLVPGSGLLFAAVPMGESVVWRVVS